MIAAAPAWAEWLALALAVAACAVWGAVVVLAVRWLRKMKPTIEPLLAMFVPAPADTRTDEELLRAYGAYGDEPAE